MKTLRKDNEVLPLVDTWRNNGILYGNGHLILPKLLTKLTSLLVFSGLNIFEANNNSVKFKLRWH